MERQEEIGYLSWFIAQDIDNIDLSDNDSLRYINENTIMRRKFTILV